MIFPIIHQFDRALRLLLVTYAIPYMKSSKGTTHCGVLVSLVEDFVTATLDDLVDSHEEPHYKGDIPLPIGENIEGDKENFHFLGDKPMRDNEQPNNDGNLNSKEEESLESNNEEEN